MKKKLKIGLALGSGAARGLAHIGVLKVLEENKIPIDLIAGTSIGALVGGAYAVGMSVDEMERIAMEVDWKRLGRLMDFVIPRAGFINGKKVKTFIKTLVKNKKIEELKIPFAAVATDIYTGEEVVIQQGLIVEAIRASASIPGIFTPVRNGGKILVDGGLVNPIPISVVKKMGADIIIAVNVISGPKRKKPSKKLLLPASVLAKKNKSIKHNESRLSGLDLAVIKTKFDKLLKEKLISSEKWKQIVKRFQKGEDKSLPNIITVLYQAIKIAEEKMVESSLRGGKVDILINPQVGQVKFTEFNRAEECIRAGELATLSNLALIKEIYRRKKLN